MYASILPGRIRARLEPGFPQARLEELRAALSKAAAGLVLTHNPRSGAILVTYPPGPKRDLAVRRVLDAHLEQGAPPKAPLCVKWPSMRVVKQGMAAGLGLAMVSLAFRGERVHALAGGVFLAGLARHLYVYRKRLFK